MRLSGRVQRLETAGGSDAREEREVAPYLAALRAFGGGESDGEGSSEGAREREHPITTRAALLAALRGWGAAQWKGGAT